MNKIDIIDKSVVSDREASDLAAELGLRLYRVSVKENQMVAEVFDNLAVEFFKKGILRIMNRS
jgi:putative ribosome biogenesis GTPase RsgA